MAILLNLVKKSSERQRRTEKNTERKDTKISELENRVDDLEQLTYPTLAGRHRRMHAKTRTCGIQVPGNMGDPGYWSRSLASL